VPGYFEPKRISQIKQVTAYHWESSLAPGRWRCYDLADRWCGCWEAIIIAVIGALRTEMAKGKAA